MTPADPQLLTPALIRRTLTYRWVCLGLLFVSGLLAFFTRLAPAVVIPDLREAFALNAAELGLLTSLYLWPFALMQPVAGVLTDRFGSRRTVTAFLTVAGVGQVLFAFAPSLFAALVGRALTGLGASILYVGAARIMAQWFRPREFGTLTGAWTSVANLGALTAAAPLMALITLVGWRPSLGGVGVVMLATAVLIYLLVRDNPSERGLPSLAEIDGLPQSRRVTRSMSLGEGVLVVLREPNTWLLGSYAFLLFGTMTMMQGLWAVPYLMDAYGQTQQQAANRLTLWAIGLIVGCTLWGYLADRFVGSR
jgi:sugar phosphate permease